jgi:hypothetical protein
MAKKGEAEAKDAGGLPEVEVMLRGLLAQPGVEGFLVFNQDGASKRAQPVCPTPRS